MISNTPKIEHIAFSVNLLRRTFCICLTKKCRKGVEGARGLRSEKMKNAIVIVD
ncbi:unnamed protein product [Salmonella enterica subsp. enterica serovar Dublin]|nr:unnamed protein product [Salmonella enterica subsp. enterica serovar Dublin]